MQLLSFFMEIQIAVIGFLFYKLLFCFLDIRNHIIFKICAYVACTMIAQTIIYAGDMTNITFNLIGFFLLVLFLFKGSMMQKAASVFLLFPIVVGLNFLEEDIGLNIYLSIGEASVLLDDLLHFAFYCIRILIYLTIYFIYRKKIVDVRRSITTKMWGVISIICIAPFIAMITVIYFPPESTWMIYPVAIANIITSVGCINLTIYICDMLKLEKENLNLKIQGDYYNQLEESQLEIRKIRHDMNNHLGVIGNFIKNDEKENATAYFNSLSDEFEIKNRMFCKNGIVNAVINSKYNYALNQDINCFFNIDLDNLISIDDISLCSIFANTLDNAIEASLKIENIDKRQISVKARYTQNFFSYEIVNVKTNEIQQSDKQFVTSKANKKMHGIGLRNVEDAVDKYKGTIDITHTRDSFSVVILIQG